MGVVSGVLNYSSIYSLKNNTGTPALPVVGSYDTRTTAVGAPIIRTKNDQTTSPKPIMASPTLPPGQFFGLTNSPARARTIFLAGSGAALHFGRPTPPPSRVPRKFCNLSLSHGRCTFVDVV